VLDLNLLVIDARRLLLERIAVAVRWRRVAGCLASLE
jgi:hypothetical protein